jgi:glutamate 5-kinase
MNYNKKKVLKNANRIVVKVGSNVLTKDNGLNLIAIKSISKKICRLIEKGGKVILASSVPIGVEELTTTKFVVFGDGQVKR